MIPILYDANETAFTSNGLGRLADCISCTVTEERNGIYECEIKYPISGEMYSQIQEGCIVGVIHDDVKDVQPFDIYGRSAPLNGIVTFYAHHISYRLSNIVLKPMTATSCAEALAKIPQNTYTECPFSFWTDKAVSTTWNNVVPNVVRAILAGQAGSILDVYGKGEYEFDKFAVKLYTNRGVDNGVSIRYGVNLSDLTHDIDTSGNYTAVVPFWQSTEDDGTVVTLPEGYVMVSVPQLVPWTDNNGEEIWDNLGRTIHANVETSSSLFRSTVLDLSESFETQPTVAQLRAEAQRRLTNSEAWLPDENIKVSFVDLAHTEEYKDVAALQRVRLCDRVSVYCGPLGVSAVSMQVIRTVYDVLTERYDEIELGKPKVSFAQAIMEDVEDVVSTLPTSAQIRGMLDTAIDNATDMITGASGGHVRFVYDANGEMQEILIMDTDNIDTAVNVWRWNSGGLGFSSHGYGGPYNTAITQNGQIVADMITTGSLTANIIKSGVIDGNLVLLKLLKVVTDSGTEVASFSDIIRLGEQLSYKALISRTEFKYVDTNDTPFLKFGAANDEDGKYYVTESFTGDGTRRFPLKYKFGSYYTVSLKINNVSYTGQYGVIGVNNTPMLEFDNYTPPVGSQIVFEYYSLEPVNYFTFGNRIVDIIGVGSCSIGRLNSVSGYYAFAQGYRLRAIRDYQHVVGLYNTEDNTSLEIVGNGSGDSSSFRSNARTLSYTGDEWIAGTLTQASDARLKEEVGVLPDVSSIRARRFRWNDKKGPHDDKDHIGYFAQDVEQIAPYLVGVDAKGYKSLDYIALLCAKVEALERKVEALEKEKE